MLDGLLDETGHDVVHIGEIHLRDRILDLIDIETRLKTFDFFFVFLFVKFYLRISIFFRELYGIVRGYNITGFFFWSAGH